MSRFAVVIAALLALPHSVNAQLAQPGPQWFAANVHCTYTAGQVACAIANTGNQAMYCTVRADGQLANGQVLYAFYNNWLGPGAYGHAYVYTSPPHPPFVGGTGNGWCRF